MPEQLSTSAAELDRADELASFRDRFHIPDSENGGECVYLCGNSLGLQPKRARAYVEQELEDWRKLGVEGHFAARNPWMPYHELLTEKLARIAGALPIEVVAMNTLTVNLHLMLISFYRPSGKRTRVLTAFSAFPSDRYALASQIAMRGLDPAANVVEILPRQGESAVREEDIEEELARDPGSVALILMDGVNYYTGQALDMARITRAAHAAGALAGFDLAHAAGNLPLELHAWGADFAVWCSYKYLNGGPGCVGGCFVHERHARSFETPRLAGWWGHDKSTRFKMGPQFSPIAGAEGWQLSNPPILPLAALRASLEIFEEAGLDRLRAKSAKLTGYLAAKLQERARDGVEILTPLEPARRGCQLSIRIGKEGRKRFERLLDAGVICDWREPDVIRVAPVPLYNRFADVDRFVDTLCAE